VTLPGVRYETGRTALFWLVGLLLAGLFVALLLRTAWMSDDAYITLRTVSNFVEGRGLTWNPGERVQAYTHPLWMLALSGAYAVTREAYLTTLAVSFALALTTLLLIVRLATSPAAALFAIGALVASKASVDYATGGLENGLANLLLAAFFLLLLGPHARRASLQRVGLALERRPYGRLAATSCALAMIGLTRLDLLLLAAPAFGVELLRCRRWFAHDRRLYALSVLAGFLPLALWELFSVVYYGAPFPNTMYAKLATGVPADALWRQGVAYLGVSTELDPVTSFVIGAGVIIGVIDRRWTFRAMAVGIVAYLAYIVSIGGDFMAGRFLTAPFLVATATIAATGLLATWRALLVPLAAMLVVGLLWPYSALRPPEGDCLPRTQLPNPQIADERRCYYAGTGLMAQDLGGEIVPSHLMASMGREAAAGARRVQRMGAVGLFAFFAGPKQHVIDVNALADPLLARLPVPVGKPWRIGHFERMIPAGYYETLDSGENRLCDAGLRDFYEALQLVTNAPILSSQRLATIWRLNTGGYQGLLDPFGAMGEQADMLCNAGVVAKAQFAGAPALRGFSTSGSSIAPGGVLDVMLYWQGEPTGERRLSSFLHLRNGAPGMALSPESGGEIWAQEGHDLPGGRATQEYWAPQVYADHFRLRLPADLPAGKYLLEAGWYDPQSSEQMDIAVNGADPPLRVLWRSVLLPDIEVTP
jgi:arabinofuranosyltransferase